MWILVNLILLTIAAFIVLVYGAINADLSNENVVVDKIPIEPQKTVQIEKISPTAIEFVATAYCACEKCCGKSTGITASGEVAQAGITIAADWDVLPKYTEVEIEGIGRRIVHDTGSNIKGYRIDIFFDSHEEALQFGRRTVKVYVLEGENER